MSLLARPGRTYGSLEFDIGGWRVTNLPPHVSLRFKAMFPRIRQTTVKTFYLNDTADTCSDLLWFLERFPLLMSTDTRQRLLQGHQTAMQNQTVAGKIMSDGWTPPATALFRENRAPYPYQAQAAAIATRFGRLLLLDEVGLGKTISALATLDQSRKLPAAIVVQAHLTDQWAEEYIEPFTTMSWHIIKGTKPYELPPADIYLFRYSNIAGWVDVAATGIFKAVVFDEIQELRHGAGTAKGAASKVFADAAELRMGLTATPVYNYGSEAFNVVEMIAPGALGSWHEFVLEWCGQQGNHWIVKDPPALGAYLLEESITLRRTELDVDSQLEPLNTLVHQIEFDTEIAEHVAAEARMLAQKVLSGSFVVAGQAARELDMMARHNTGMAKAAGVAALVRMLVEGGEKVLCAGWHRDVYDTWMKALGDLNPVMFTGSETAAGKKRAKKAFIEGASPLIFMSLRSGAGLDGLQDVCSTAVIGELDWSPMVHKQFIGRLRRPGQKKRVDALFGVTDGGSDPVLMEMLGLKANQAHGITDPFTAAAPVDADEGRMKRLAAAYLGLDAEAQPRKELA